MNAVIVPYPEVGDGFANHAGKSVVVVHLTAKIPEIHSFAVRNNLVASDGAFWILYHDNPEGFRAGGCRPTRPPLKAMLRGPHLVPNPHRHGERRKST